LRRRAWTAVRLLGGALVLAALAREAADRMGALLLAGKGRQTATTEAVDSGRDEESPAQMGGAEGTRTPDPHTARPS
jgi:integrase